MNGRIKKATHKKKKRLQRGGRKRNLPSFLSPWSWGRTAKRKPTPPNKEKSGNDMQDIGFIVARCIKKKEHNILFKECYNAIRKYHPTVKIVFIDDNSDKSLLEEYPMTNVEIIPSEYIGAGEYLPYYYLLSRKLFKKAVLMQDSMMLNSAMPFDTVDKYKFLLYYNAVEAGSDPTPLLEVTKIPKELKSLHKSFSWSGCFGGSMIVTYDFLKEVEDKVGILCWKNLINTRDIRVKFETAIALACICVNHDVPPASNTVAGHLYQLQIMRKYNMIGKNFDIPTYLQDRANIQDKIIKVFNGR